MSDLVSTESTDLRGVVNVLVSHAIHDLGVDAADVLIYDAPAQRLVNAGGRGFRRNKMENAILHLEDTPAGKAVTGNEIIRISNISRAKNDFVKLTELTAEGLASYVAAPLSVNNQIKGVLELWSRGTLNGNAEWLNALEQIAEKGAIAVGNVMQARRLVRSNQDLTQAHDAMIEAWSQTLELRNYEPKDHNLRVTEMTVDFARILGLEAELANIRRGALLHDIGMIGIPDSILLKPGTLTDEEWAVVRQHPMLAYEHLSSVEYLKPALDIPRYHHEKWDGTGYPYGLKGEQIPLAARLFALVDTWESLRSDRPFRKGWPEDKVKQHIADRAGKQFDPDLADRFLKLLEGGKRKQPEAKRGIRHDYDMESFIT